LLTTKHSGSGFAGAKQSSLSGPAKQLASSKLALEAKEASAVAVAKDQP
jgi:hypothetical protein